jgi:hypothetical protein
MANLNGKGHGANFDPILHYAAPSANHLYANPRKAGVGIADQVAGRPPEISLCSLSIVL